MKGGTMAQTIDTEKWFTRRELPELFAAHGIPMAEATLATRATRKGGPPFRINSRRAEYWGPDALVWRRSLLRYRGSVAPAQPHNQAA